MIRKNSVFLIVTVVAFTPFTASARALRVGPGETFTTIQSAIDVAVYGDIIIAAPGTYYENIYLAGKAITVISTNPFDWAVVAQTIINAAGSGAAVTFKGSERPDCTVSGFTITGGADGGIQGANSRATVSRCIVTENTKDGPGAGIYNLRGRIDSCYITANTGKNGGAMATCSGTIINCVVSGNDGLFRGGLVNCDGDIVNCTIAGNTGPLGGGAQLCDGTITNCIIVNNSTPDVGENTALVAGSCFPGGADNGNIDADPMFADYANGDFYLLPGSPCIDAGTNTPPGGQVGADIDGNPRYLDGNTDGVEVVDMGAYESAASEEPVLSLSVLEFYFTALQDRPNPDEKILIIDNYGGGIVEWTISGMCKWLQLSSQRGSTATEYDEVSVGVNTTGLAEGDYFCQLTVSDPNALNSPQVVSIHLHVEGPAIALSKTRYDFFAAETGEYPDDQVLTVSNPGGGILNWQIEQASPCQWLEIDPVSGSITDQEVQVVFSVNTTDLVGGDYDCRFTVSAPEADNSPQTVSVHLHIGDELFVPSQYPDIVSAIDNWREFDTIIVAPGTYYGPIYINGRNIVLTSSDPDDPDVVASTIIDAAGAAPVVTLSGNENANSIITGFTITGGYNSQWGGGIVGNGTAASISNCIIEQNYAEYTGAGIHGCSGLISNCLIRDNSTITSGGGLAACHGKIVNCVITGNAALGGDTAAAALHNCDGLITNCTIADNLAPAGVGLFGCDGEITNCIIWGEDGAGLRSSVLPRYSCYPGGAAYGSIDAEPAFFSWGDYRITRVSPCVDAGRNDPPDGLPSNDADGNPRLLDGDGDGEAVVDMGAYEFDRQAVYIHLSTQSMEFNAIEGEAFWQRKPFLIANGGAAMLQWQITEDSDWLNVVPDTGSTGDQPQEVGVIVDIPGLEKGRYSCQLTIFDPSAVNSPRYINVTLYVRVPGQRSVPAVYPTIQSAVDAAYDGDVIVVDDGVYTGPGNRDIDFNGKAITLRSQNGPDHCIIDCQNAGRGFYFHSGEGCDSIVDGFTVTNGRGKTEDQFGQRWLYVKGGAVYNYHSSPSFINCRFIYNRWDGDTIRYLDGGGMYNDNSSPRLIKCIFAGNRADYGAGLYNVGEGGPTLINCIFSGNTATLYGGAIYNNYGDILTLINCTLVGNAAKYEGGGIETYEGGVILANCILWDNATNQGRNESAQVRTPFGMPVQFYHNCIASWTGQTGGIGNISNNPFFVDPGLWIDPGTPQSVTDDIWIEGDYHLKTQGWRWDPLHQRWGYDSVTSPCIDAGNPAAPLAEEWLTVPVDPAGEWGQNIRINMGAYGGTEEASIGPVNYALLTDITNDRVVNVTDLALFAAQWLRTHCSPGSWCGGSDFSRDSQVGLDDLRALAHDWLKQPWRRGPMAHWKLDGNYRDNAGNHDGSASGEPVFVTGHFARVGSGALRLDGIDDSIRIFGWKGVQAGLSRTCAAWIRTSVPDGVVVAWGPNGVAGGRWVLAIDEAGLLRLEVGGAAILGTQNVCDGQWHHIAAVLDNDGTPDLAEVVLYVDGRPEPLSYTAQQEINTQPGADVRIGTWGGTGRYVEGIIDEVRIYDRALSAEEIVTLAP